MGDHGGGTWSHAARPPGKPMAYCPPSDFRVNMEAGLRTALSAGFAFLWLGLGPHSDGLSFFAGVAAIVCVGNSAGQTIARSLEMTHGALIGSVCAVLPRFFMQWGSLPAGAGFFVAIFLVVRSRRLSSLGKKFGSLCVALLSLANLSDEGLNVEWVEFMWSFVRAALEGGVFALAASLLPYPRFATKDGGLRAQFVSRSLSAAVHSCMTGFVKGRDETSMSRARLLCLQVRENLRVVRMELEWSRLELGLLFGGCAAGGMRTADALEELADLMEQVLQGVRGLRQSLSDMHRTRAQASFAGAIGPSLRELAEAIDESLEVSSRRTAFFSSRGLSYHQHAYPLSAKTRGGSVVNGTINGETNGYTNGHTNGNTNGDINGNINDNPDGNTDGRARNEHNTVNTRRDIERAEAELRHHPSRSRQSSLPHASERLEAALAKVMTDYDRARREILYGLDESGRPLESSDEEMPRDERSPPARGPVPFEGLQMRAERKSSISHPSHPDTAAVDGPSDSGRAPAREPVPPIAQHQRGRREEGRGGGGGADGGGGGRGGGVMGGAGIAVGGLHEVPNHLLVMKERQKLGSSATMARGAFLFSLAGLCKNLTEDRIVLTRGWRASNSAVAARFALSGAWKAVRPPPGLLHAVRSAAHRVKSCCCLRHSKNPSTRFDELTGSSSGGDRSEKIGGGGGDGGVVVVGGGGGGGGGGGDGGGSGGGGGGESGARGSAKSSRARGRGRGRWRRVVKSPLFWSFKVSVALTLCAAFRLSSYLDDIFDPAVWIVVTACFVMENQSASAVATSLLRLIGTVLGAVYGIVAAKLSSESLDDPYNFRAHAILLPWVAVACFFRNSADFGYAALVAAFTAVIVFTGSITVLGENGESVSLARIVNTVIGSVIYLLVDIIFVPMRAKALVLEHTYYSLDAALNELSLNGERMFGVSVCPRALYPQILKTMRPASDAEAFLPPPIPPTPTPRHKHASSFSSPASFESNAVFTSNQVICDGDGRGEDDVEPGGGNSWGRLLVGEKTDRERPEGAQLRHHHHHHHQRWNSDTAGVSLAGAAGQGGEGGGGGAGGGAGHRRTASADSGGSRKGRSLYRKAVAVTPRAGGGGAPRALATRAVAPHTVDLRGTPHGHRRKRDEFIQKMVTALALQKQFLPLAELEPQLWYKPFPASAYEGMVTAQEELLRALTLMSKAAIAVSEDRSTSWRQELDELGSHLSSLVQLLKIGLEDARDAFESFGQSETLSVGDDVDESMSNHGTHLLDVHAEAIRLDSRINTDFVRFIQVFLERGEFPDSELESILRINTAVISVMGLQKALLSLGHAVAAVLDRELFGYYYR